MAHLQHPPWSAAAEGEAPIEGNSGTNANVYWVCNYLGGPMTQLPPVTPVQIKAARQIKKLLTGRLTSQVSSYPVFPGTEANYLRAQVRHRGILAVVVLATRAPFRSQIGYQVTFVILPYLSVTLAN
jgi:hypothetical protein